LVVAGAEADASEMRQCAETLQSRCIRRGSIHVIGVG
jgi:hypothetical protein